VFGIDVSRIHWDMTSFSVYGEYEQVDEAYAVPKFGHPKDRRPDLKQVQAGLGVAADGGGFGRAYDGGAGEVAQVIPMMKALQQIATTRRLLIVGDTKLVSYDNLAAMHADEVSFVAPASKVYVPAAALASLDLDRATRVDYVAARDKGKDPDTLGTWHVYEDTMTLTDPKKKRPALTLRRVFVHSSARAQAAVTARGKKLDRAGDDLARLTRGLGSRHYPDVAAVEARLVAAYLRATTGTCPDTGKPTLTWHFDQQTIDAEAATDGGYALLTNLEAGEANAAQVLLHYKGQEAVERRYSAFKGPLAVAAIYLKNNRRIIAMITVICLALLIFSLIEREVRGALRAQGRTTIAGLYAGRPAVPTTRLIMHASSGPDETHPRDRRQPTHHPPAHTPTTRNPRPARRQSAGVVLTIADVRNAGLAIRRRDPSSDLRAGVEAELVQGVADVTLHRALRDEQPRADLLVAQTVGDEPSDVDFSLSEDSGSVPAI
jgi:hypothetical protein